MDVAEYLCCGVAVFCTAGVCRLVSSALLVFFHSSLTGSLSMHVLLMEMAEVQESGNMQSLLKPRFATGTPLFLPHSIG